MLNVAADDNDTDADDDENVTSSVRGGPSHAVAAPDFPRQGEGKAFRVLGSRSPNVCMSAPPHVSTSWRRHWSHGNRQHDADDDDDDYHTWALKVSPHSQFVEATVESNKSKQQAPCCPSVRQLLYLVLGRSTCRRKLNTFKFFRPVAKTARIVHLLLPRHVDSTVASTCCWCGRRPRRSTAVA